MLAKGISPSNLRILIEGSSTEGEYFSSENIAEVNSLCFSSPNQASENGKYGLGALADELDRLAWQRDLVIA